MLMEKIANSILLEDGELFEGGASERDKRYLV